MTRALQTAGARGIKADVAAAEGEIVWSDDGSTVMPGESESKLAE